MISLLRNGLIFVLALLAASIASPVRLDAQLVQDAQSSGLRVEMMRQPESRNLDPAAVTMSTSRGASVGKHAAWGAAAGLATWLVLYTVVIPCDSECLGWTTMVLPGFVATGGILGGLIGFVRTR